MGGGGFKKTVEGSWEKLDQKQKSAPKGTDEGVH